MDKTTFHFSFVTRQKKKKITHYQVVHEEIDFFQLSFPPMKRK